MHKEVEKYLSLKRKLSVLEYASVLKTSNLTESHCPKKKIFPSRLDIFVPFSYFYYNGIMYEL